MAALPVRRELLQRLREEEVMGPGPDWARPAPEGERQVERIEAALAAGWILRYDPVRGERVAAREVLTARTLDGLLDAIEAAT